MTAVPSSTASLIRKIESTPPINATVATATGSAAVTLSTRASSPTLDTTQSIDQATSELSTRHLQAKTDPEAVRKTMNFIARFVERHYQNKGLIATIARLILRVWPSLQRKLDTIKTLEESSQSTLAAELPNRSLNSPRSATTTHSSGSAVEGVASPTADAVTGMVKNVLPVTGATDGDADIVFEQETAVFMEDRATAAGQSNTVIRELRTVTVLTSTAARTDAAATATGASELGSDASSIEGDDDNRSDSDSEADTIGAVLRATTGSPAADADASNSSSESDADSVRTNSGKSTPVEGETAADAQPAADARMAVTTSAVTSDDADAPSSAPIAGVVTSPAAEKDRGNESDASSGSKKSATASSAPSALPGTAQRMVTPATASTPTSPSRLRHVIAAVTPTRTQVLGFAATAVAVTAIAAVKLGITGSPV